ncbi:MAG: hypothetical protein J1F38_00645 [Muribaculaceae bacterium]|nr:hypothetical protein [Muribaculaceae bacterium]
MESIYEPILSGTDLWDNDIYNFLPTYFADAGAAISSFLIAFIVAAVFLVIFYFIFGMGFPKIGENIWVWVICLGASFGVTWVLTDVMIIGDPDTPSGIYEHIDNQMQDEVLPNAGGDQNAIQAANAQRDMMVQEIHDGCGFTLSLLLFNSFLAFFVYGLGSLGCKRLSKYGKNVPVSW